MEQCASDACTGNVSSCDSSNGDKELQTSLQSFHSAAASYNIVYVCMASSLNALLAATVVAAPSLRTPPNAFLLSLCVNNILLSASMAFPVLSAFGHARFSAETLRLLDFLQVSTMYTCHANYWLTFAAVGHYRYAFLRVSARTPGRCWRSVRLAIALAWALSFAWSSLYVAALVVDGCLEGRSRYDGAITFYLKGGVSSSRDRAALLYVGVILASTCLVGLSTLVILKTYFALLKIHNMLPQAATNKVTPSAGAPGLGCERESSSVEMVPAWKLSREACMRHHEDVSLSMRSGDGALRGYRYACGDAAGRRGEASLFRAAAPAPAVAGLSAARPLGPIAAESFLDISAKCAQPATAPSSSFRMVRRSWRSCLTAATKNSLVIFAGFFACSLPFQISSIPGALQMLDCRDRVLVAYVAQMLFYLSPVIQPLWYLVFTRRVRRTLSQASDCFSRLKLP